MTFYPSKPAPGDFLNVSVNDIQGNFSVSNTVMGIDHYPFDTTNANKGKHKKVSLPRTGAIGSDAAEIVLFGGGIAGPKSALFYVRDNTTAPVQMTGPYEPVGFANNYIPMSGGPAVGVEYSAGYTFLAGGVIYQYGSFIQASLSPSTGTVKFPATFTTASSVIVVISPICKAGGTAINNTFSLQVGTTTGLEFKWNAQTSTNEYKGFTWIAMGV